MLQLNKHDIWHLQRVVQYLYDDEYKDWRDLPEDAQRQHIFVSVNILKQALEREE